MLYRRREKCQPSGGVGRRKRAGFGLTSRFAKPVCLSPARLVPLFAYLAKRRRVELDVRLEASEVALKVPEPFVQRAKVAAVPAQRLELCRVVGICESRSEEFALVDQGSESNLECRFALVVELVDRGEGGLDDSAIRVAPTDGMGRRGHLFELSFELEEERGFVSLEEGALFSLSDHDAVDGRRMRKQLCLCRRRLERLLLHIVSVRRRRPSWHVRFEEVAHPPRARLRRRVSPLRAS